MKKNITFLSLFFIPVAHAYDVDCDNIKEMYDRAQMLMDSDRDYYRSHAVDIIKEIYEKCKNKSSDRATLALTTSDLASAYWRGVGVGRNYPKSCELMNELLDNYSDVATSQDIAHSQLLLGDGARNAFCEERNWTKAVSFYQQVVNRSQEEINPNTRAWAQARLADAYRDGDGVEQSFAKSIELFTTILTNDEQISDKSVVAWAKFWIADAHEHARSVEKDLDKAHAMFTDIVENYKKLDPIAVTHAQDRLKKMEEAGYKPQAKQN